MSELRYMVKYGYLPSTPETIHQEWWGQELYETTDKNKALIAFEYLKNNRPHTCITQIDSITGNSFNIPANILFLRLVHKDTENIVTTIETYCYEGNERTLTNTIYNRIKDDKNTYEDRPHIDLDPSRTRAVGQMPKGTYIVYSETAATQKRAMIGLAYSSEGVQKLLEPEIQTIDVAKKIIIEYHPFIETSWYWTS